MANAPKATAPKPASKTNQRLARSYAERLRKLNARTGEAGFNEKLAVLNDDPAVLTLTQNEVEGLSKILEAVGEGDELSASIHSGIGSLVKGLKDRIAEAEDWADFTLESPA